MNPDSRVPQQEWSVLISEEDIGTEPVRVTLEPSEEERHNLARRLDLQALNSLKADLVLERQGMVIHVKGHLEADVTQSCVITREPVAGSVSEDYEGWFADPDKAVPLARARKEREARKTHAETEILEEFEDPEPLVEGHIDVGELTTQYLSLALNPYPHAEGAEHLMAEEDVTTAGSSELRKNPFAALKSWKEQLNGEDS